MNSAPRFYRYVITFDANDAPCTDDGMVTLATCKPAIRRGARPGDWIAAFLGVAKHIPEWQRGALSWVGKVASKIDWSDYFVRYPHREDARYAPADIGGVPTNWGPARVHGFRRRPGLYHLAAEDQHRDLKAPVLVFDQSSTWYFGDKAIGLTDHLRSIVPRGQGHRIAVTGDIASGFMEWLAKTHPAGVIGNHPDTLDDAEHGCAPLHSNRRFNHSRPFRARSQRRTH